MALSHILKYKIVDIAVVLMFFATVIDLGGGLGIKYASYTFALFVILLKRRFPFNKSLISFGILFIICPILSFIWGICNNAELNSAIIQITPFIPAFFLLLLLDKNNINIALYVFNNSLLIIAILTIAIYLLLIVNPSLIELISGFMINHNMGFFGNKDIEGSYFPNVYFKSVLFLNFAFIIFYSKKQYYKSLIIFVGILLSFSKSATIGAIICWILLEINIFHRKNNHLYIKPQKMKLIMIILSCSIFLIVSYWHELDVFYNYFVNALTGKSATTIVRIKHFESVIQLFSDNPRFIITGQGLGTRFYTSGFGRLADNIEIDHINTIRKFGFIWSTFFYYIIIWEILILQKSKLKQYKTLCIAFFSTFILVGTNPLLISPLFLMLMVLVYKIIHYNIQKNDFSLYYNI
ncbi:hypothetical protein AAK873_13625 [Heminiphilus faecis]|uniref:O-antigen polymerase n=1 Tax=Heminiphilus faecis TaxID=2601703 RepID=A0ABV4D069_9BACT